MQVILAVDIKQGKVVKAFAGFRLNYKPLKINTKDFSDPIKFISFVIRRVCIKNIYLADLDSISKKSSNQTLIENILKTFPEVNFMIDSGFDYPSSINFFCKSLRKRKIDNFQIVLGTENLRNFYLRGFFYKKNILISLDLNGKEEDWLIKIRDLKNKPTIILMFLRNIGGRGIDWKRIQELVNFYSKNKCFLAGGIKHQNQINRLKTIGINGVIVSTLIHKKISRDNLMSLEFNS